ncbi:Hypothetical protein CpE55_1566 [Corynebacterium pseudotuberculosis]|nr:Hypothetical protein CpE55_1566 [Corynebacterium pseudotuberculosis]
MPRSWVTMTKDVLADVTPVEQIHHGGVCAYVSNTPVVGALVDKPNPVERRLNRRSFR